MSKIQWTDESYNPVTGCSWISPGCNNCYAKVMANRLHHNPKMKDKYRNNFKVTVHPEELKRDFGKKHKKIFVCSMSDLFHDQVPFDFIDSIMGKIALNPQHTFQILTKRPGNALNYQEYCGVGFPDNVWFGVTLETEMEFDRLEALFKLNASVRFVSIEPMLDKIDLSWALDTMCIYCGGSGQDGPEFKCNHCVDGERPSLDWVIVGGETGPKAREMNPDWARSIRDQCQSARVPFFFKQMSKKQPIPDDLNIKQFPK